MNVELEEPVLEPVLTDEESAAWDAAVILAEQGRWDEALTPVRLIAASGRPDALMFLGLALEETGDICGARAMYHQAAELGDPEGLLEVAFDFRETGDLAKAIEFGQAAQAGGSRLAAAAVATWKFEQTHDLALEADLRAGVSEYEAARTALGQIYLDTSRTESALSLYREGAALGELDCLVPLANLLIDIYEELDEAEDVLRRGAADGDAHACHNLGLLLLDMDRDAEALVFLKQAIALGDNTSADLVALLERAVTTD